MVIYDSFIKNNVAPTDAAAIVCYDKLGNVVFNKPLGSFKPNYGTKLYSFGVLSDVHNQSAQTTENMADLQNALTIFNQDENIKFVCICGDISENGTEEEFQIFKNIVDTYSPDTIIYTTTGNHDCTQSGINDTVWESYVGNKKTFSFNYNINGTSDIYFFLGMNIWSLGESGVPYLTSDIEKLESVLKKYKNNRVFIFTHLFFPTMSGNLKNIYPSGNWLGGEQLNKLQELCDTYKNAIWFSGHSHWMWYLQQYQDNANIDRKLTETNDPNSSWTVHIPSCASPIDSDGVSTRVSIPTASEGAIVDVYEEYIVVKGVSFKKETDSNYTTKYLPIAHYLLGDTNQIIGETGEEVTLSWELGNFSSSDGSFNSRDDSAKFVSGVPVTTNTRYFLTIDKSFNLGNYDDTTGYKEFSIGVWDSSDVYLGRIKGLGDSGDDNTASGNYFDANVQYLDITKDIRTFANGAYFIGKIYCVDGSATADLNLLSNSIKINTLYDESVEDELNSSTEEVISDLLLASHCTQNPEKLENGTDYTVTQLSDGYIQFNFTNYKQGFLIKTDNWESGRLVYVEVEDYVITSPSSAASTNTISKVGFYTSSTDYTLSNGYLRNSSDGVQFNVSSSYGSNSSNKKGYPITIKLKARFIYS